MNRDELLPLIPKHRHDHEFVGTLRAIGFPALNPVLPEMLDWTKDMNWPVANPICGILTSAGPEIAVEIRKILSSGDHEWIWFIVSSLLPNLKIEIQKDILPDLVSYRDTNPGKEYVEVVAEYLLEYRSLQKIESETSTKKGLSEKYPPGSDVLADLSFLATDVGGKTRSMTSGYKPQYFYNNYDWDVSIDFIGVSVVKPGENVQAYLNFLSPDHHFGKLRVGDHFLLREGKTTVGYGHILEILNLEESAKRIAEWRKRNVRTDL